MNDLVIKSQVAASIIWDKELALQDAKAIMEKYVGLEFDEEQLPEAKLEIQDWSNRPSETGNYVYIEGIIKNIGKGNAYSVQVTAKGLDKYGNLVALEKGYTTPTSIAPDKTATFQIMMKNYEKLDKFGLSWNWNNES